MLVHLAARIFDQQFEALSSSPVRPSVAPPSVGDLCGATALPNKGMKQTSVEHIGRSQLIPCVRRT